MGIIDSFLNCTTANIAEEKEGINLNDNLNIGDNISDLYKSERYTESKALIEDPLSLVNGLGYKDKMGSLTYDTLKRVSVRNSVVGSVILTRVNQVSTFTKPARYSKEGIGFEVSLKDSKKDPTPEDKALALSIESFIENCGYSYNPSRDDFTTLAKKLVRDSLIYDQMAMEIVPDVMGRPAELYAVDASTVRAASIMFDEDNMTGTGRTSNNGGSQWVQVVNGTIVAEFTGSELAFGVRNPRTDLNIQPYGLSEIEILINQITSHIYAEEYNSRYFSQGGTTKGILNIKGHNISKPQLEAFRRQWSAQVMGMTGAWKTPVVSVEGLEYINVSQSNREMEYEQWMNYLINICCHPKGTLISMGDGSSKNIEYVEVGDYVVTHLGRTRKVVNTQTRKHNSKMYTFNRQTKYLTGELSATGEHPLLVCKNDDVYRDLSRGNKLNIEWTNSEDIQKGNYLMVPRPVEKQYDAQVIDLLDYLDDTHNLLWDDHSIWFKVSPRRGKVSLKEVADVAGIHVATLRAFRCKSATSRLSKETIKRIEDAYKSTGFEEPTPIKINRFINIDEEAAQFLGLYVAEGFTMNNAVRLALGRADLDRGIVARLEYLITSVFGIDSNTRLYGNNCDVSIHSLVLHHALPKICGHGADNKIVPLCIMNSPLEIKKEFIRGYIWGDGSIPAENANARSTVTASTVSKNLATMLHSVLLEFGILPSIRLLHPKHKIINGKEVFGSIVYEISFGGKFTKEIYPEWVADGSGNRSNYCRDDKYFYVKIRDISITECDMVDVYNFEVEEDHSFLANGVCSHNCAVYQIDPAEINFPNRGGSSGSSGGLGEGGIEDRLKNSKDKGLRPLLRFLEDYINKYVVQRISPRFKFAIVGIDPETENDRLQLEDKQIRAYKTVNEIRKRHDLPEIEGGDIILDGTFVNWKVQQQQQQMMEQQQETLQEDGQQEGEQEVDWNKINEDSQQNDDIGSAIDEI